jgi:hypothetical protein
LQLLTEKEQAQVRSSIAGVADRAAAAIGQSADGWRAVEFVVSLHSSIDTVMTALSAGDSKPDCKPGCAFCCGARVEVSDPEALHIARHLMGLPAARQQTLFSALTAQSKRRSGASPFERITCAFLAQDLCSIYEHRPAACRKAHSLSLKACSDNEPHVPQNLSAAVNCEVLIAGTNEGYLSSGLPASRHELSAAVLAAVTSGETVHNWFRGESLLHQAQQAKVPTVDRIGGVP